MRRRERADARSEAASPDPGWTRPAGGDRRRRSRSGAPWRRGNSGRAPALRRAGGASAPCHAGDSLGGGEGGRKRASRSPVRAASGERSGAAPWRRCSAIVRRTNGAERRRREMARADGRGGRRSETARLRSKRQSRRVNSERLNRNASDECRESEIGRRQRSFGGEGERERQRGERRKRRASSSHTAGRRAAEEKAADLRMMRRIG